MADQAPTVFGSDQTPTPDLQSNTSLSNGSDTTNPVALLVGEGRKYKTVEDLAKAYVNVDEFAEKLKGENATLREKAAEAATLQQVLDRLKAPEQSADDNSGKQAAPTSAGLSATEVAKIVGETLTGLETQRTREANIRAADAALKKVFGDKATEVFNKAAPTADVRKALMQLAAASPDRFLEVFVKPAQVSGSQADHHTSVNTAALLDSSNSGRAADPGTKEFYDDLRKKEPSKYYSQAIQLQMQNAAIKDRSKFYGR
jgi:hypothetical protein